MLRQLHLQQTGRLFTFGFSQGGHSALALHRALQGAGVHVAAPGTVGGVFDVEQWFLNLVQTRTTVTLPLYASYIMPAYDDVYGIYDETAAVFRKKYARTVGGLFDMQHYFDDVVAGLAPHVHGLVEPAFEASLLADPQHLLRLRLRENAVDGWTPQAPLRVYHSEDDEEVPYEGALVSVERMRSSGADVSVEAMSRFDHVNSWIQAMPRGRLVQVLRVRQDNGMAVILEDR